MKGKAINWLNPPIGNPSGWSSVYHMVVGRTSGIEFHRPSLEKHTG